MTKELIEDTINYINAKFSIYRRSLNTDEKFALLKALQMFAIQVRELQAKEIFEDREFDLVRDTKKFERIKQKWLQ